MLGEKVCDPLHVESENDEVEGLGLLPYETSMHGKKNTYQVLFDCEELPFLDMKFSAKGMRGYEIHMGESTWKEGASASTFTKDTVTGNEKREGTFYHNICGTYVHGIFDKEEVALGLVKAVGDKKGIDVSEMEGVDFAAFKETQYDILAA